MAECLGLSKFSSQRYRISGMRLIAFALAVSVTVGLAADAPARKTTKAEVDKWFTSLSNWGRWGKADEVGTYNLITDAKRREAAALVKDGVSVSMAHNVLKDKAADNSEPFQHK